MKIAILQIYCGASGQFGAYNCQEVGLAKALAAMGHECLVVYPDLTGNTRRETLRPGAEALFLPAKALSVHAFYKLNFLLTEGVERVLLLADNHLFAPAVHRFCKKHGILCANYIGALYSDSSSAAKRRVMNLLAGRNIGWFRQTPTFAKTPTIAAELKAAGVPNPTVAPVALDLSIIPEITESREKIRQSLGLPTEGKMLLFVGRLDPYKKPLEMADLLADCPADTYLVCIGKGSLADALHSRIRGLGLTERFYPIEFLPNAEVQRYFHAADLFLNFNDHEIFGMSILEAMYAGCPVAARHAPGPDFMLRNGETGFLCDTAADFLAALEKAVPAVGQAAHREVLARFQWSSTAKIFLDGWEGTACG